MTSRKLNSALFGSQGIGVCRDPRAIELFTRKKEDPSKIVDDPIQTLMEKHKELLKDKNNWMTYGSMSKNEKNFYRMSGYNNDGAYTPLGGIRVIYEPPLRDSYSDVVSPVIKLSSLALEDYNKREGTNYKYVGLLKAYVWSIPPKSHTFEITFTASEALQSDFEDVSFQTKVCYSTHGRELVAVVEHVSKCNPSAHP